ncbi:MAG: DegQ family serine endoprotease [Desulfovibrio sp.]|jgi:serine protease Do|nr:DegQ family serine endoprotease [Desulfovibrio sp.]
MRTPSFAAVPILLASFFLSALSTLAAAPVDFRDLVKRAGPAVVNINTERTEQIRRGMPPGFDMFRGIPDMERFFDQFEDFPGIPRSRKSASLGSGFIISADGYIVTNNHVIEEADAIRVSMGRVGKEDTYEARLIGADPMTDLALIKIEASGLPFLVFGDSDALEVGEWVVAIGSPLGLDHTVTAGIISAKGRSIQSGPYDDFLQTDASINQGNSGGPLINMDGQVVGINTAIAHRAQGIGFAIPSSMAQEIIATLREHRKVSRGWLGVTIQNVDEATAKALGLDKAAGALVNSVLEGQPAEKAGIQSGDVILAINGREIEDTEHLLRVVAQLAPGSRAALILWREGQRQTVSLTVEERGAAQASGSSNGDPEAASGKLGLSLRPVTQDDARRHNLKAVAGLLVTALEEKGLAARAGIQAGDIILAVNNIRVNTVADFRKQVDAGAKQRGALLLHISRRGQIFFKAITVKE